MRIPWNSSKEYTKLQQLVRETSLQVRNSGPVLLATRTIKSFVDHDSADMAAGLAYYAFFSIFPLILALIALFSLIGNPADVQAGIVQTVGTYLLPGSTELVAENVRAVIENRESAGLIAILSLLWSASAFFTVLRKSINRAWDVEKERSFIGQKVVEFTLILVVAVLLFVSIGFTFISSLLDEVVSLYLRAGSSFIDERVLSLPVTALNLALGLVPIFLTFFIFTALYRFIPNTTVRISDVLLAAWIATILFEIAKWGFVWYVTNFGRYNLVYGSLASVIALLFWAYVSTVILILGAEMASEYSKLFGSQKRDV